MGGGRIATPPDSPATVMATAKKNPMKSPDGDAGPMQQVVIANRLTDGVVVFLGRDRQWVTYLKDCPPAETPSVSRLAMTTCCMGPASPSGNFTGFFLTVAITAAGESGGVAIRPPPLRYQGSHRNS